MRLGFWSVESSRRKTDPETPTPVVDDRRGGLRPSLINVAAAMVVMLIVVTALKELESVLRPLFIAIFLFYVADPAVDFLARRRVPYSIAFVLVLGGFAALTVFAIFGVSDQVGEFAQRLPAMQERLRGMAVEKAGEVSPEPVMRAHLRTLIASHVDFMKPVIASSVAFISRLPGLLWDTFLVAIYIAFLIQERRALPHRLIKIYGPERTARIEEISERINRSIARYIYIKLLASLLKGAMAFALMAALHLEFAAVWSALIFAANFIPYVGSILSFAFPIGMSIVQFDHAWKIIVLGGGLLAIDFFVGNYWEPRVSGQRLNVSPLIVVLSLAFWGWLWGVTGMILSVPITVSIRFILENIPYTRPLAGLLAYHEVAPPAVPPIVPPSPPVPPVREPS